MYRPRPIPCFFLSLTFGGFAQARTLAEIEKTKELRVCYVDYPGVATAADPKCTTDCVFSGPAVDVTNAFVKKLGPKIKIVIKKLEWDEQFHNAEGKTDREASYTPKYIANGSCDFYPNGLSKNEWRLKKLDFAPLYPNRMLVIIHKNNKGKIKKAADLGGKTFATTKDTTFHTWAQKANENEFKTNPIKFVFQTTEDPLKTVDEGRADFTIQDADGALYATKHEVKNSIAAFPVGDKDEICWAFGKDHKDLKNFVEVFFEEQRKNEGSDINKLWENYFGMNLIKYIALVSQL